MMDAHANWFATEYHPSCTHAQAFYALTCVTKYGNKVIQVTRTMVVAVAWQGDRALHFGQPADDAPATRPSGVGAPVRDRLPRGAVPAAQKHLDLICLHIHE